MAKYYVHESTYIELPCSIGDGTQIWHFCHIMPNATIGKNCILGQNVFIGSNVHIGNNVKVQNNVSLYTGVICENDVFIGPSVVFTNIKNPRSFIERKTEFRQTTLRQGATIGANATIICGTTIGKYAFIGAGTLVTKDVPDHALAYGIPAKLQGWVCRCSNSLEFGTDETKCGTCGKEYIKIGNHQIMERYT